MDIIDIVGISFGVLSIIIALIALWIAIRIGKLSITSQIFISELYEISKLLHGSRIKGDPKDVVKFMMDVITAIETREFIIRKCGLGEEIDKIKASINLIQKLGPSHPKAVEEADTLMKNVVDLSYKILERLDSIFSNPFKSI